MTGFDQFMLPCLWKKHFNIECMGCGMQRSLVLVFKGEFVNAFYMYPAIYTLIVLVIFLILHIKFQFKKGAKILLALFILNMSIIIISYIIKFL
jgi:hypothetical protein